MQVYTELVAPSAVRHSLALPLTSPSANNLVVAKGSLLQIFSTTTIPADIDAQDPSSTGQAPATSTRRFDYRANDDDGLESSFLGGEALVRTDRSHNTKLILIAEIPLAGTVIGLARIKLKNTASGGEALLLAYKAAKLCLTEWDPRRASLETISIHYYEKDDLAGAPWEGSFGDHVNYLEADPGSRCAALHFGTRNLAILPFRQSEEDLEMEDWDEDLDGPRPDPKAATTTGNEGGEREIPHMPSFVLRLPLLDPALLHPVHLAFLHEYREPTFGILYSSQAPSRSLRLQDSLAYKVFTLDLQQKASTTILSVTGLPLDLEKVVPLPGPIGGALLVGQNEIIHVDQSGKTSGVAVNPMTRQMTSFILTDQSDLKLRLERCTVQLISGDSGELLLVTNDGGLYVISFQVDGRTVSGLTIKPVSPDHGGNLLQYCATCMSKVGKNVMFIGSDSSDSVVLGWARKHTSEKRKKNRRIDSELELDAEDLDLDDDDDDDDDLYGNGSSEVKTASTNGIAKSGLLHFRIHDTLFSIAPIREMAIGKPAEPDNAEEAKLSKGVTAHLQLTCAVGRGKAGGLAILNREIQPKVIGRFEFPEARGFWTFAVKKPAAKALAPTANGAGDNYDDMPQYDKYMIVAKVDLDGYETSDVYALTAAGFESLKESEFEPAAGFTVEAGSMGKGMRIVQALKSEVRVYDGNLGLTQILPMLDEETGAEPRVLSASIADPYLMLLREDHSILVASMDSSNYELEEVDKTDKVLTSTKWVAGCLYTDTKGIFKQGEENKQCPVTLFLLSSTGALHVYNLPDLSKPVFVSEGLTIAPPILPPEFTLRRGMARDNVKEILVADIGDRISQTPYLICRHDTDDLTLYQPIRTPTSSSTSLSDTLIFKKCPNPYLAKPPPPPTKSTSNDNNEEDDDDNITPPYNPQPLRACSNINGLSTVFLPEASPSFLLKSAKSTPKVIGLQGLPVRGMSPFHTEGCDRGFIYADSSGIARVTQLPPSSTSTSSTNITDLGISVQKVPLGVDVEYIAFHEPTTTYIAGCSQQEPFTLPHDDDYHKEWAKEPSPHPFPPNITVGSLRLISPHSWSAIHILPLEECESIHCMKSLTLEVSEDTHERRPLLAVGTGISKGEDLPTRGRIQVFDIVTVIPQPNRPETNRRLKQIAKEDIPRGAVTALSHIGTQGLLLIAQGQKCMVRGLKEDGSMLPVAFLDMGCHVASARELPRTGLCLMADAFKGVWFAGYTEEPYTFKVLGKSNSRLPLLVADLLPDGEDLAIVAADADGEMHILEFNPAHRGSLEGQLLLHNTTFSLTPNHPSSSLLLPTPSSHHTLLLSSPTGQVSSLTPLSESSYRRLLSLSNQLLPSLVAHGGLNPKAHRYGGGDARGNVGVEAGTGRGVVDGVILRRWMEISAARRSEVAGRTGYEGGGEEMRDELRSVLGWSNLTYF